jgi:Spy/CpxP family protein refolding chaperone
MKRTPVFFSGLLAAVVGLSTVAGAQQAPPPAAHAGHAGAHGHGMMRALHGVNLSDDQRSQIQSLMQSYRQSHPKGSAPDPQARKALRQQIMGVLTPDQQSQVKANLQQMRAERRQQEQGPAPQPQTQPQPTAPPTN